MERPVGEEASVFEASVQATPTITSDRGLETLEAGSAETPVPLSVLSSEWLEESLCSFSLAVSDDGDETSELFLSTLSKRTTSDEHLLLLLLWDTTEEPPLLLLQEELELEEPCTPLLPLLLSTRSNTSRASRSSTLSRTFIRLPPRRLLILGSGDLISTLYIHSLHFFYDSPNNQRSDTVLTTSCIT